MSVLPSPVAVWSDSAAGRALTRLVPFKTTGGYWVFLPRALQPAGSLEGIMRRRLSGVTMPIVLPATGHVLARGPRGVTLIYGQPAGFVFLAGDPLGTATFTRASVATYAADLPPFLYDVGDAFPLGSVFSRSTSASYTASV